MITLEPLSEKNILAVTKLEVAFDQAGFVAPNVFSIAESKVFGYLAPRVLRRNRKVVGFALYGQDSVSERYYIVRLMIGGSFQGQGYGREAVRLLVAEIQARNRRPCGVYLSVAPDNTRAIALYEGLGFEASGEVDDGEVVYHLDEKKAADFNQPLVPCKTS
jgi:diamine N-acetyltransferase